MKRVILGIFLLIFLGACNTIKPQQDIKIVKGYEGQLAFVEAIRGDTSANIRAVHEEKVINPYYQPCIEGGENMTAEGQSGSPIKEFEQLVFAVEEMQPAHIDELAIAIEELKTAQVDQLVAAALQKSMVELPGPDTTICVFALYPSISSIREYLNGVSGFTAGAGQIVLFLFPEKKWEEVTKYTVAHEYHHSVWIDRMDTASQHNTLLEYLIFEGRADTFAHIVYPSIAIPWVEPLPASVEEDQWREMQIYLAQKSDELQARYMFGDDTIPQWTGYKIGYQIVQAFIHNHPEVSIADWTEMNAQELLEKSGYNH